MQRLARRHRSSCRADSRRSSLDERGATFAKGHVTIPDFSDLRISRVRLITSSNREREGEEQLTLIGLACCLYVSGHACRLIVPASLPSALMSNPPPPDHDQRLSSPRLSPMMNLPTPIISPHLPFTTTPHLPYTTIPHLPARQYVQEHILAESDLQSTFPPLYHPTSPLNLPIHEMPSTQTTGSSIPSR